jgi:hypothetical protein
MCSRCTRGVGARHPLRIAVLAGETVLGTANWHFPDVICGHADPMHFAADLDLDGGFFERPLASN